jgi:squalene synthase HpnD
MTAQPLPETALAASAPPAVKRSSFYAALRILPAEQREAMYQVYAFCRAVDDIADEGGARPDRIAGLRAWRRDVADLYAGKGAAQGVVGLEGPVRRFRLLQADFDAIVEGMMMDAEGDIRAPDWPTLDLYCDRVASAVGRLAVRIFGVPEEYGPSLAHHLGRALQLTNILRDLDEDAGLGRLYLPREALDAAGIAVTEPAAAIAHPRIGAACEQVVQRARGHFAQAWRIINSCPRASTRSPRLMAVVYGGILDDLVKQGFAAPRRRVRVRKARVLWAIVRHGLL